MKTRIGKKTVTTATYTKLDGTRNTVEGVRMVLEVQLERVAEQYPNHHLDVVFGEKEIEFEYVPMTAYERAAGRRAEAQDKWSINNR